MSYAGVESEKEYVQRQYNLVPREAKSRRYDEGVRDVKRRLSYRIKELEANDNISWLEAFELLKKKIEDL